MQLIMTIIPYALGNLFLLIYISEHIYPQRKDLIDHQHDLKNIFVGSINTVLVFIWGVLSSTISCICNPPAFWVTEITKTPFFNRARSWLFTN